MTMTADDIRATVDLNQRLLTAGWRGVQFDPQVICPTCGASVTMTEAATQRHTEWHDKNDKPVTPES